MADRKEKGKAKADSREEPQERPLTTRITQSASGLAKDLLSNQAGVATSSLANSTAAEKSRGESSNSMASGVIERLPSKSTASSSLVNRSSPSFREHAAVPPSALNTDGAPNELHHFSTTSVDYGQWDINSSANIHDPWFETFENSYHAQPAVDHQQHIANGLDAKAFAEQNDGSEVIALLNELDPEENWLLPDFERGGLPAPPAEQLFAPTGSAEEQAMASRLRAGLPPAPDHNIVNIESQDNLQPDLDALLAGAAFDDLTDEQRKACVRQWYSVLTSYTDDVWGSSLSHVEEAKKEIEQIQENNEYKNEQALRRLRMVLEHITIPKLESVSSKPRNKPPVRFADPHVSGIKNIKSRSVDP